MCSLDHTESKTITRSHDEQMMSNKKQGASPPPSFHDQVHTAALHCPEISQLHSSNEGVGGAVIETNT